MNVYDLLRHEFITKPFNSEEKKRSRNLNEFLLSHEPKLSKQSMSQVGITPEQKSLKVTTKTSSHF